jgi:Na+/proline symporter
MRWRLLLFERKGDYQPKHRLIYQKCSLPICWLIITIIEEVKKMYAVITLIAYAAVMLIITHFFTKKDETAEGYLVGNRNNGVIKSALSIAATWIWAPALFVSAEKAYTNGIPGLFWFLAPNALCLILFIPFVKRIREQLPQGITLSGYMAKKYRSKKVKGIYTFQLGALSLLSTAVQLLAGSKILSVMTGCPFLVMTVILAAIGFFISQFAGLKSSVNTDAFQMVFMLIASAGFLLFTLLHGGNTQGLLNGFAGVTGDYTSLFSGKGLDVLLSFGIPTTIGLLSGPFGDQSFWQLGYSVKRKVGAAFTLGAFLFALVPLAMGFIGFIAAGAGYNITDISMVNFQVITQTFPLWACMPFLFMALSGLLSTVDSNLCSISALAADGRKTFDINLSRIAMVCLLAAAVLIANIPGLTVTHLFLFYGTFRASTLLPTVLTLKGARMTANGVFWGILFALLVGYPIFAYGNIANIALWKTVGSLTTVLSSGLVALALRGREGVR